MKDHVKTALAIAIGMILAGLVFWIAYTTYQNEKKVDAIVLFINNQIAASQKQQSPTQAPVPLK